jgi:hypothetical protein
MLAGSASRKGVDNRQQDTSSNKRDDKRHKAEIAAVNVIRGAAKQAYNQAAKERANNTDDNVHQCALLRVCSHYDACKPTDERAKQDPQNEVNHGFVISLLY